MGDNGGGGFGQKSFSGGKDRRRERFHFEAEKGRKRRREWAKKMRRRVARWEGDELTSEKICRVEKERPVLFSAVGECLARRDLFRELLKNGYGVGR